MVISRKINNIGCMIFISVSISQTWTVNEMYDDKIFSKNLFEGDLKLPIEMILTHYNASSVPNGRALLQKMKEQSIYTDNKNTSAIYHAAISERMNLWPNGIVYYKISPTFTKQESSTIQKAILHWEENTCLHFLLAGNQRNYLYINNQRKHCYSEDIGYSAKVQTINLGNGCVVFDVVVHEIGHAVGFWHEQNRPDRNKYINLRFKNIPTSLHKNFMALNDIYVDYYGVEYDYGSIMHYSPYDFVKPGCKGSGCVTFTIANETEYRRQGAPFIGLTGELSLRDIAQVNRMYSCSGKGITGFLLIRVKYGSLNLSSFNSYLSVLVEAADKTGEQFVQHLELVKNALHPVWSEIIFFSYSNWQFFRISVHDVEHSRLTQSRTIPFQQDTHYDLEKCDAQLCSNFVLFEYTLDTRPIVFARLKIYTRSAMNLISRDSSDIPDPYVRVDALKSNRVTKIAYSEAKLNTTNPVWNYWIDFGCHAWKIFFLQVFDENVGRDYSLSDRQMVVLKLGMYSNNNHICYGSGHLIYDYELIPDFTSSCTP